ncbi:hypothetical protein OSB04_016972 [Centaurea solstitialis]|uniref:Uncharacterized protein n=1 Tax=Centaurea solstitialis TaxID=347529 RepID=A0AA38TK63_9ASTR|nr:hypothetical protein OSB04_016972 [Centaurea solstitialis]
MTLTLDLSLLSGLDSGSHHRSEEVPLPTRMTFRIPTGDGAGDHHGSGPRWVIVVLVVLVIRIPAALSTVVGPIIRVPPRSPPPDHRLLPHHHQFLDPPHMARAPTPSLGSWSGQPAVDQDSGSPQPHHGITPPPVYGGVFGGDRGGTPTSVDCLEGEGLGETCLREERNPGLVEAVSEQVMALLPGIVSQVAAGLNTNQNNNQGSRGKEIVHKILPKLQP